MAKQIQHRSMRGKPVDMELLRKKNELTPAIGNARVNARGDVLGPGGKIVKKREDVMREYYEKNPNAVSDESQRYAEQKRQSRNKIQEDVVVEDSPVESKKSKPKDEVKPSNKKQVDDVDPYEEEWIEDDDGNFVKKGD